MNTQKIWFFLFIFFLNCSLFLIASPSKLPCGNCNKMVSSTVRKCPYCKAEFDEVECSNCHRTISSSAKKCPYCNFDFKLEDAKKTPSQYSSSQYSSSQYSSSQESSKNIFSGAKWADRISFDGYFRVSARNDIGHGSQTLGWWSLYGRLLNETNWYTLGILAQVIDKKKKSDPGARVYMRIEGDSFRTGDSDSGNLGKFAITQFYFETENIPIKNLITQTGTLWYNMGYISIYDMYIGQTFWETVGFRAGIRTDKMEWFVGLGDSGYTVLKNRQNTFLDSGYNSIPTLGGLFKKNLAKNFWMGSSLMIRYEMGEEGNPNSPHQTSNVSHQDILRGDVIKNYINTHPTDPQANNFPGAKPVNDLSWRWTFWMGFGDLNLGGLKLKWNDLSVSFENSPSELAKRFTYQGITKDVYISSFTDDRLELTIADESHWEILPGKLDMLMGLLLGYGFDTDNQYLPNDRNRLIVSAVFRPQYYITEHFHWITEASFAMEKSLIGNRYREHYNSIQANTGGIPDINGLEWGDTDTKYTIQFKWGLVFNPLGKGINNRPSVRFLFGSQYSNVHGAFGNSYNESLNRQNRWNKRKDIPWHHMVSLEVEYWF